MNTDAITAEILGSAFRVSNGLGVGFLEEVYENALVHELRKAGLLVRQQESIPVVYDGVRVGDYYADLIVSDSVIVEVKAARGLDPAHEAQLLNYLRATSMRVGLILNFGTPRLGVKRMML